MMATFDQYSFYAESGDIFVVRECTGDDNCIVLERFKNDTDDESIQSIDIPTDVAELVAKAIVTLAREIEGEAP